MRHHILTTILVAVLSASSATAGDAVEVDTKSVSNEQEAFFSSMQSWVQLSLNSAGDNQARYVLKRIGCSTKSEVKEHQETGSKKNQIEVTIEDDIGQCQKKKSDFFCLAVLSLVKDLQIPENKYYYYCQSSGK